MSDFDDVLERLLTDPPFASALAADPDVALAGYRLADSEIALLRRQVVGDTAADVAKVETRTNKSSTFGLLAPFAALGGLAESVGHSLATGADVTSHAGLGDAPGGAWGAGGGSTPAYDVAGGGPDPAHGAPGGAWGAGGGSDPAHDIPVGVWGAGGGMSPAAHGGLGDAPATQEGLGPAPHQGVGSAPAGHAQPAEMAAPPGYHPRVDADGDGHWDRATYRGDGHGGAEILVDLDHDGRADFIGHDTDLDHKVDYADYDTDHDGVIDKRMYDDDNDGWLDRTVRKDSGS
jgi:hypothetical protein